MLNNYININKNTTIKRGEHNPILELRIPERSPCPKDSILDNHKKLKQWLGKLPRANIGEISRQVFNTLVDFNRAEIEDINRIKIAETFRVEVDYIVSNLEKHYRDSSFPLTRKSRKIAVLARELYKELADSYKVVLDNQLNYSNKNLDKKLLTVALHRAMRYLGQANIIANLIYERPPKNIWYEIHQLYAYSAQNWLHQIQVKDNYDNEINNSTIQDLYKRVCLVDISANNHLSQPQIYTLLKLMPEWSKLINIYPELPKTRKISYFIIDLWSDESPQHISLAHRFSPKKHVLLDASPLLVWLKEESAKQRKNEYPVNLEIINNLIRVFEETGERSYVRTKLHFEFAVITGLNNIFELLLTEPIKTTTTIDASSNMTLAPDSLSTNDSFLTIDGSSMTLEGDIDSDSLFGDSMFNASTLNMESADEWSSDSSPEESFFHCRTINESAGGYCIRWHGPKAAKIKIGEIVGIRSPSAKYQFSLAAVRWLKNTTNDGLQAGVKLMATQCAAAEISTPGSQQHDPALLLPEIADSNQQTSIVTTARKLKIGSKIQVTTREASYSIQIIRLIENTGLFLHYEYDIDMSRKRASGHTNDDNDDFSDIWSTL